MVGVRGSLRRRAKAVAAGHGVATEIDSRPAARIFDYGMLAYLLVGAAFLPLVMWPRSSDVFVGPKFETLRLLTAGGALAAVGWHLTSRSHFVSRCGDVLAAAFLILNVVAYVVSVDPPTSLLGEPLQQVGLTTMFGLVAAYAVARSSVRVVEQLVTFLSVAAIAGTAVAAYGVIQLAGMDPIWSGLPDGRVFSTIGQPNWLAALLVMTVPLTIAVSVTSSRSVVRHVGWAAVLLQLTTLLATRSRSGYLGLAAVAVIGTVGVWRSQRRSQRTWRQLTVTGVLAALLVGVSIVGLSRMTPEVAPTSLTRRAMSIVDVGGFDAQRYVALWKVGTAIIADHPLTGTGQDTYAIMFPEYRDKVLDEYFSEHFAAFRPESPHNAYLAIASGTGIPTLLAYLALVGSSVAAMARRSRSEGRVHVLLTAIVAATVGHLVTDLFMTMDLTGSWLFWALMGMGLTIAARPTDEHRHGTGETVAQGLVPARMRPPG